jgi:iron(III) transport system substrate-binding protein
VTQVATVTLLLVACGRSDAAPETPAVRPASAPAAAAPAAQPPAAWEALVAGARQEGQLVISLTQGELFREVLLTFMQEYPFIQMEITPGSPSSFWARVQPERAAGQYLWDLRVAGAGSLEYQARLEGVLDPVRPVLVLPEVLDDSKWLGGLESRFFDNDKQYFFGMFAKAQTSVFVNRDFVPEAALATSKDLIDPRWRGKIALLEPRSGSGEVALLTMQMAYGPDFVRDLLSKQEIVVSQDGRQLAEWVVRGRYPIGIGVTPQELIRMREAGVQANVTTVGGPQTVMAGPGMVWLLNRAPHPNAAALFINWLLSRDVQAKLSQRLGEYNSARLDVPVVDQGTWPGASKGQEYIYAQGEEALPQREVLTAIVRETVR